MKLSTTLPPLPQRERLMIRGMDEHLNDRQQRFLQLFLPTRERLWRFVRALTHADRDTVDEIMSETVFRVYQRFEHLREESAFRSYCFQVARRVAWDMAKKARRQWSTAPDELPEQHSDSLQPDTATDIGMLYDALALLKPKLRETLVLFEIADCSLEEIRTIQGGTLSGVKSRLLRARTQLAELMQDTTSASPPATGTMPSHDASDLTDHLLETTAFPSSASIRA